MRIELREPEKLDRLNEIPIIFRNSIPEIPSTTYGVFSIYKYPAKFIPQVIAYVLKKYAKPNMKVFDPFAGYGTVGLVSRVYGFDYELWDLNPLIEIIHRTALNKKPKIEISQLINGIKKSRVEFKPAWSNLCYWVPDEFLPILCKAWGFTHSQEDDVKFSLMIPLLKTSRYFSKSDEKIHKLYISKHSKIKVRELLKNDWKSKFYSMLEREIKILFKKQDEYEKLQPKTVNYRIKSGKDVFEMRLDDEVDILITSPPYLQAQEYIRSTKFELFWLGFSESTIKELSRKEIPYREVERIKIYSENYYKFLEEIKEEHLKKVYERYFHAILKSFVILGEKVKKYMFIFVGPAKIRTTSIPIDLIIIEHLRKYGWKHEITYIDKIVSRVMFESGINPASGNMDNRIKTEHLVVLKKKD